MLQSIDFSQLDIGQEFFQNKCKYVKNTNTKDCMNSFNITKNECSIVSGQVEIEVNHEEEVKWDSE